MAQLRRWFDAFEGIQTSTKVASMLRNIRIIDAWEGDTSIATVTQWADTRRRRDERRLLTSITEPNTVVFASRLSSESWCLRHDGTAP